MLPKRVEGTSKPQRFLNIVCTGRTRSRRLSLLRVILSLVFLLGSISSAFADPLETVTLPDRIGKFRKLSTYDGSASVKPELFGANPEDTEQAEYLGNNGVKLTVEIIRFSQDDYAYEFLSLMASGVRQGRPRLEIQPGYGTAGFVSDQEVGFVKGRHFVRVSTTKAPDTATRDGFISELSANLDKGEGDIPVLIKHLPHPEEAQKTAVYLRSFNNLDEWFGLQSNNTFGFQSGVFSAIESGRNADAVFATYGPSKVVIIEFNTPQLATDNDKRIVARIRELWDNGQPAPTAYRRVGNYSVFVFDAPDEQTAKQLINGVKYEQVVQWLGENPNIYKEAERRYINTTLGVLVAVMKASGYAIVACLGIGGLIGGLLFTYRRAQQKGVAFSDAGGMMRLNLDELTAETNPSRLLRERN